MTLPGAHLEPGHSCSGCGTSGSRRVCEARAGEAAASTAGAHLGGSGYSCPWAQLVSHQGNIWWPWGSPKATAAAPGSAPAGAQGGSGLCPWEPGGSLGLTKVLLPSLSSARAVPHPGRPRTEILFGFALVLEVTLSPISSTRIPLVLPSPFPRREQPLLRNDSQPLYFNK